MRSPRTPKLHLPSRVAQNLPVHESTVCKGRASTAHVPYVSMTSWAIREGFDRVRAEGYFPGHAGYLFHGCPDDVGLLAARVHGGCRHRPWTRAGCQPIRPALVRNGSDRDVRKANRQTVDTRSRRRACALLYRKGSSTKGGRRNYL
jgi:hypothetical protein